MANEEKEVIIDEEENNEEKEEDTEEGDKDLPKDDPKGEDKNIEKDKGTQPEKPVETLEQRKARLERQLKQVDKKLGINDKPRTSKKSEGFDYGEKAFLTANGIKGTEEHEFAQRLQKQTGLDLDTLIEDNYFKTKLTEYREGKTTSAAIPNGTKRANNSSVDTVEYWIAKGELPPKDQVDLRRKVVNARLKKEDSKGVFYNS